MAATARTWRQPARGRHRLATATDPYEGVVREHPGTPALETGRYRAGSSPRSWLLAEEVDAVVAEAVSEAQLEESGGCAGYRRDSHDAA